MEYDDQPDQPKAYMLSDIMDGIQAARHIVEHSFPESIYIYQALGLLRNIEAGNVLAGEVVQRKVALPDAPHVWRYTRLQSAAMRVCDAVEQAFIFAETGKTAHLKYAAGKLRAAREEWAYYCPQAVATRKAHIDTLPKWQRDAIRALNANGKAVA